MNFRRVTSAALLASIVALVAHSVSARENTRALKQKADEYFSRGEVMFESGEFAKAAAAFTLAYETYPLPAVLANIGLSYDKAGNIPKAVETLRFYLSQVPEENVQKWVPGRLSYLEKQVGEMTVECSVPGCTVHVDGAEQKNPMKSLILAPGKHSIEAYVGSRRIDRARAKVKAGALLRIVVGGPSEQSDEMDFSDGQEMDFSDGREADVGNNTEMDFVEAEATENNDEDAAAGPKRKMILRPPFWISAGVTAVAATMAIAFGVATKQTEDSYHKAKDKDLAKDLQAEGKRQKVVANVMVGFTIAGAAASVVFAIIDVRRAKKKSSQEDAQVRLTPMMGLGLGLTGKF